MALSKLLPNKRSNSNLKGFDKALNDYAINCTKQICQKSINNHLI